MSSARDRFAILALSVVAMATGCATSDLATRYDTAEQQRLVPMLEEVLRFPTVADNDDARENQKAWLATTALSLGLEVRDAGTMTEIELPGPPGSPVLGLVVHGDVVAADPSNWTFAPFDPTIRDGVLRARGAADDKGPLVQALVAMKVLADSGKPRHATIRLLVGTNEESASTDVTDYLKTHAAPNLSLVLDSAFPVVVGEKGWSALSVSVDSAAPDRAEAHWHVEKLDAGLATSIVPDRAELVLRWNDDAPDWAATLTTLRSRPLPDGTRADIRAEDALLTIVVYGHAAHAGVNLGGGRNALVALAGLVDGVMPDGPHGDLLSFATIAGRDIHGGGLGFDDRDPLWGAYDVNVATIKPGDDGRLALTINIRRTPPRDQKQFEIHLRAVVERFNKDHHSDLRMGGYFEDEPFFIDPASPAVRRLLASYERATGTRATPVVSGGGTYAKRLPNSIAFGMWFPGSPYPGHDVDEEIPIESLHTGVRVLLTALDDLVSKPGPLPTLRRVEVLK